MRPRREDTSARGERGGHRCELPPRPKVAALRLQTARRLKDVSAANVSSGRTS